MYGDRPFNLAQPAAKAPTGSPADAAMHALQSKGFDIIQNPSNQSELVEQFIGREFGPEQYDWAQGAAESRQAYRMWRERQPERELFVLADQLGMLAAAGWVGLRNREEGATPAVSALAFGGIRLYDGTKEEATHFLQVTQAYAYRRYAHVRHGILMSVSTLPLIQACVAIGYEPVMSAGDGKSGNLCLDMVVSSGPLEALNAGKPSSRKRITSRSSPQKPHLRLIKGD